MEHWPATAESILQTIYERSEMLLLATLGGLLAVIVWDAATQQRAADRRKTLKWFLQMVPLTVRQSDPNIKHMFNTI
jgi:hypothetical protein